MLLSAVRAVNSYNPETGSDLEVQFMVIMAEILELFCFIYFDVFGFSVLFLEFYAECPFVPSDKEFHFKD